MGVEGREQIQPSVISRFILGTERNLHELSFLINSLKQVFEMAFNRLYVVSETSDIQHLQHDSSLHVPCKYSSTLIRGCMVQLVVGLTHNQWFTLSPIKGSPCFLDQEASPPCLITGWFQEQNKLLVSQSNQTKWV